MRAQVCHAFLHYFILSDACSLPACVEPTKLFNTSKARPFLDKTPFPNRNAPAGTPAPGGKLGALLLPETPGYLLRPSSTRKSVRARRSSGRNYFETPVTNGCHWDVSDSEIEVAGVQEVQEEEAAQVEDYDEIEYMPPSAIGAFPPAAPACEQSVDAHGARQRGRLSPSSRCRITTSWASSSLSACIPTHLMTALTYTTPPSARTCLMRVFLRRRATPPRTLSGTCCHSLS
jgi:hypothetical protein